MQFDIIGIPDEGIEVSYQENPSAISLSPDLSFRENLEIHATLYKSGRTVIVSGEIQAAPSQICGRCSVSFFSPLNIPFNEVFVPKPSVHPASRAEERRARRASERNKKEPDDDEEGSNIDEQEEYYYEGNSLSLDEMIREQVLLAVPMRPLCSEDCKGLCAVCGADLNKGACGCPPEVNEESIPRSLGALLSQHPKLKKGE